MRLLIFNLATVVVSCPLVAQIPDIWPIGPAEAAALLVGPNVQITNVEYTGDFWQMARFTDGSSKIGFPEGIALTTGRATYAGYDMIGGFDMSTGTSDWAGDRPVESPVDQEPDLDLMNGAGSVKSAAVLEFDITTTGTELFMQFVFASEEYPEYVCSNFNDVFGIFLSGPGIAGPYQNNAVNIASIPGTSIPISINTLNSGEQGVQGNGPQVCAAQDPNWTQNSVYYVDNLFSNPNFEQMTEANAFWVYDGHTIVLTVQYIVQCNTPYHLKYAICNTGDYARDSGMFIKARSITSPHALPGPLSIAPSPVCAGEEITLTVQGDPMWHYSWSTGQSGVGLQTVTTTASLDLNSYSVTAEYLPGCTLSTASLAQQLTVHNPENVPPQCLGVNGTGEALVVMNAGHQTCFTIPTSDTPNESVLIVQSGGNVPGGSFTDNGGFQETGRFCWTPSPSDIGYHTFESTITDGNVCGELQESCVFDIKVICDYCPVDIYYEGRIPEENPLPAETVAGASISAGYDVDPAQQNGFVWTGNEQVLFRAPVINLETGFTAGPGFQAIIDPNTCLEDCNDCCTNWSGFTVDTYAEGTSNVFEYPFTPNGDGVNDAWQVFDVDNAYCAYGATSFRLWITNRWGGEPVWLLFGFSPTCCQFDSWAPDRPGVVSSIYWDGTVNFGNLHDHGEYVPSGEYEYILDLYGCGNTSAHYTGYIGVFGSLGPSGMVLQDSIGSIEPVDLAPVASAEPTSPSLSLGASSALPELFIAPNPASEYVYVEYAPGLSLLRIFDSMGRSVREISSVNTTRQLLDVSALAPGTYVLKILALDGSIHQRTVIKQ